MPSTLSPLQNSILASVSHSPDAWRLTGGGALAGYHLGHRTTEDLDLFLAGNGVFDEEPRALVSQLVRDGFDVAIVQNAPGFKRYTVSKDQDRVVVDLVADSVDVIEPPTRRPPGVLVDTAQEILTNKLTTLLSRAEVRDLVDVAALVDVPRDLWHRRLPLETHPRTLLDLA